jgi:integrase
MLDKLAAARRAERAGREQGTPGSFAADIARYLRDYYASRPPRALAERTRHLGLWCAELATTLGPDCSRAALTRDEVSGVLQRWRAAGLAAETCNHRRTALLALFHALDGKGGKNPVREIPKFRVPPPLPRALEYADIDRALARLPRWAQNAEHHTEKAKTRVRLGVIAYTGMRPAELAQYQREDWNRKAGTLLIHGTAKGGGTRPRTIPLSPQATAWLKEFDKADAYGSFSASPMVRLWRQAWYVMKTGATRTPRLEVPPDFPAPRPYDLRHSFATQVYKATGDIKAVQKLLGHSSLKMTDRYTLAGVEPRQVAAIAAFSASIRKRRRGKTAP